MLYSAKEKKNNNTKQKKTRNINPHSIPSPPLPPEETPKPNWEGNTVSEIGVLFGENPRLLIQAAVCSGTSADR